MFDTSRLERAMEERSEAVHPLLAGSFFSVPSAGMRHAPEVLVLELMREVFFETRSESSVNKLLDADERGPRGEFVLPPEHRAVLHVLKGRRKGTVGKHIPVRRFYAPAYPNLARTAWMGKNRERVLKNFLFSGPVAQTLRSSGDNNQSPEQRVAELAETVQHALLGCDHDTPDILLRALGSDMGSRAGSVERLCRMMKPSQSRVLPIRCHFANRITEDLRIICEIEKATPRMQWIQTLMTFLRFSMPMWLLAQLRTTELLLGWLLQACDTGEIESDENMLADLCDRNRAILHPSVIATRELTERIETYVRSRIELKLLLCGLADVRPDALDGKTLVHRGAGASVVSVQSLLTLARDVAIDMRSSSRFQSIAAGRPVSVYLARLAESWPTWRQPLRRGHGKNIDEFLRVMRRAPVGDHEGGYLLETRGAGIHRGFLVFPGQLLLKTMTVLAAERRRRSLQGLLVLQDIEDHFSDYGIEFSSAAAVRPRLMEQLQSMGLLVGSPDAGSQVAVGSPFERVGGSHA